MKIKLSLLFLAGGFFFVSLAAWQWYSGKSKQETTLRVAEELISMNESLNESLDLNESHTPIENAEVIGILRLPTINGKLPIVRGVNEDALEKGVGYYEGTALPNQNDQIVLSGHRDTVFRRLGELQIGDEIVVEMVDGTYTYAVEETFIVEADDRSVIKSTAPVEKLTLTTCYPFQFVGNAPQRYIVNAIRK